MEEGDLIMIILYCTGSCFLSFMFLIRCHTLSYISHIIDAHIVETVTRSILLFELQLKICE
jgi:hypothetical protein